MEVNRVIKELETVYDDRHQYSITWAFKNAQKNIKDFFSEEENQEWVSKNKWYTRLFETSFNALSAVEFFVSVVLVLFVSSLSHAGSEVIHTRVFSVSVILVFAFIKVFLEQHLIRPKMEKLGWKMYQRTIKTLKDTL